MSKVRLYAVRDLKVGGFNNPYSFINDAVAVRSFESLVNEQSSASMIAKYPGDYDLFCIAEFDQDSGIIVPIGPIHVVAAAALIHTPGDRPSSRVDSQA
nr:MAG: nonstructural protein [Microviridae sp.]